MNHRQKIQAYCKIKWLMGGRCPVLNEVKDSYLAHYQIDAIKAIYEVPMNPARGMFIADAYEAMPQHVDSYVSKQAYQQMNQELLNQFEWVQEQLNLKIEPWTHHTEPYKNSFDMLIDIHDHHLWYLRTTNAFGHDCFSDANPMLADSGIRLNGQPLLMNDVFRIVHDIFGHAMNCNEFGARGEDQAWFDHSLMFTPLARIALTTETRGQNSWVNFGHHMRKSADKLYRRSDKDWLHPSERPFAKQKIGIMPEVISGVAHSIHRGSVTAFHIDGWTPHTEIYINTIATGAKG